MSLIRPARARAYVNWGRWVTDCPIECGGAQMLEPGQEVFSCHECKAFSNIEWPPNADEIWAALEKRPAPKTRNWYPSGHTIALRGNVPHGQTPEQLLDEQDIWEMAQELGVAPDPMEEQE